MRTYNYLANEMPRELIELYGEVEQEILEIIARELSQGTEPQKVYTMIKNKLSSFDEKSRRVLEIMFEDIEKKSVKENANLVKEYEKEEGGKAIDKKESNSIIMPYVIAGMGVLALLNRQIETNSINEYNRDYVYTKYGTGLNELKRVYGKLIQKGITIGESISGGRVKEYSIENVIRRDVIYKINQANAKVNKENFKRSEARFIEVSSHPTARTWNKYMKHDYEDHSSWQGKCYYSKDGEYIEGYKEFESTCGYGEMLGICGINCYHQFVMNYTGESGVTQYSAEEVEKQYALSQKQRAMESDIRKLKSAKAVYKGAGDEEALKTINQKIRMRTSNLRNFCEKYDLKYYNWRTQI